MTKERKLLISCLVFAWLLGIGFTNAFAQLQQKPAEEYVASMDKPDRVVKVDEVIAMLQLKLGDIVADIGSGTGTCDYLPPKFRLAISLTSRG